MIMKTNTAVKVIAFLLAVLCLFGAAGMVLIQAVNSRSIWGDSFLAEYDGFPRYLLLSDALEIEELVGYYSREAAGETLGTYAQLRKEELEKQFDDYSTNLRWQAVDRDGAVRWGNTAEERPVPVPVRYSLGWITAIPASGDGAEQSGAYLELDLWIDKNYWADDVYWQLWVIFEGWRSARSLLVVVNVVLAVLGLALTVYLCVACCHKKGQDELHRNWFHRLPGDLLLCVLFFAGVGLCAALAELTNYPDIPPDVALLLLALCILGLTVLAVSLLVTFTARCKTHTLLRNTLIGRLVLWTAGWCRRAVNALPLVWKAALAVVCYLVCSLILLGVGGEFLWVLVTLTAGGYLCWWAYRWKTVRQGAREIIGGSFSAQIDTRRMPPDLRDHAVELNNLGQAIGTAVEERLRSEHFKAELITNVSHDLKTPLTSIISYVDLLKKESIENERVREYIEVLDRKSQRLKKLTEDLVEASKASTGALTVERERIDLVQLAEQALGEFDQRLAQQGLTVVRTLPDHPVWVTADGRHLWRVAENLLSNCAKYALEGTRVYMEVQGFSDCAKLAVKNISREKLNIPAEELTQRFVRGDESRTNEGSGLGLSIAQSLTELQGGRFELFIDGDLFKAVVTLPLSAE